MHLRRQMITVAVAVLTATVALSGCSFKKPAATVLPNQIPMAGQPVNKYDKFFEEKDGVKHFYLWIEEKEWEILTGVKVPVWSFNGTVPGPEIRVQQGDKVALHFRNTSSQPHSIHLHGVLGIRQEYDGVPATSATVNPGKEYTYLFTAVNSGTLMYHCHVATNNHVDMGMYGALIVEPKDEEKTWDHEYTMMLDDWAVGTMNAFEIVPRREYNYFTINGKAFPETEPVEGKVGDVVKIRFINMGYRTFSIHSHAVAGLITHLDGHAVPHPYRRDIFSVAPGERMDVLFTITEGIFPWHDHQLENVLNNGVYLGGATFLVIGK